MTKRKDRGKAPASPVETNTASVPAASETPADEAADEYTPEQLADADAGWDEHKQRDVDQAERPSASATVQTTTDEPESQEETTDAQASGDDTTQGGVGAAPAGDESSDEELDLEADFEESPENLKKLHHTIKTWKGRGKSLKEQIQAEEQRLQELQQQRTQLEAQPALASPPPVEGPDAFAVTDDETAALNEVEKSDPEFRKAVSALVKQQAKTLLEQYLPNQIEGRVAPLRQSSESLSKQMHNNFVAAVHGADWSKTAHSPEFKQWMNAQPYEKGAKYHNIFKEGTAVEIVSMLNDYKAAKAPKTEADSPAPTNGKGRVTREQQLRAGEGVRHRTAGAPPRAADKNDEVAGWEDHRRLHK
jgi:hypothetical protein